LEGSLDLNREESDFMADRLAVGDLPTSEANDHFLLDRTIRRCAEWNAFPVAVCWPCSVLSLAGAVEAARAGIIRPVLVGHRRELSDIAASLGLDLGAYEVIQADTEESAAELAVALCRNGKTAALMKGSLHTHLLMHAALQKGMGLRTSRRFSHVFVLEAPLCDRALFISDAAINIYPTLEDKVDIVQNATDLAHLLAV